jgi:hypothetical protein
MKGHHMLYTNMKIFVLSFLILLSSQVACFAVDDANILAAGDWSAPVAGTQDAGTIRGAHHPVLRGRLLLCESPKNNSPALYLELQDCNEVWGDIEVYCSGDNGGCRLEARDASGKSIEWQPGPFGGRVAGAHWITLPCDSTIRLRVSRWATFIYASAGDYSVSGTFSSQPANDPNDRRPDVWQGTLKLPPLKIIPKKP